MLNAAINKLPVELHIPGYSFCGPGTKLSKRLARGDRGINGLDEACRQHDIAYSESKDLPARHKADAILASKAMEQFRSKNTAFTEKMAALGVAGAMKAKLKLGMGMKTTTTTTNSKFAVKKCYKELVKVLKLLDKVKNDVNNCTSILSGSVPSPKTQRKKDQDSIRRKMKNHQQYRKNKKKKNNIDLDISDDYPVNETPLPLSEPMDLEYRSQKQTKRKLNDEDDDDDDDDESLSKKIKYDINEPIVSNKKRKRLDDIDEEEAILKKSKTI